MIHSYDGIGLNSLRNLSTSTVLGEDRKSRIGKREFQTQLETLAV